MLYRVFYNVVHNVLDVSDGLFCGEKWDPMCRDGDAGLCSI